MIAESEEFDDDLDEAIVFVHELLSYTGQEPKEQVAQDIRQLSSEIEKLIAAVDVNNASTDTFHCIRSCISTASALRQYAIYNDQPVSVVNLAAVAQLRAERAAGTWLNLHFDEDPTVRA